MRFLLSLFCLCCNLVICNVRVFLPLMCNVLYVYYVCIMLNLSIMVCEIELFCKTQYVFEKRSQKKHVYLFNTQ